MTQLEDVLRREMIEHTRELTVPEGLAGVALRRARRRRLAERTALVAATVAVLLVAVSVTVLRAPTVEPPVAAASTPATPQRLDWSWLPREDVQGAPLDTSRLIGHRVVLVSWASWCQPCGGTQALRSIDSFATSHSDAVVIVLLVHEDAQAFMVQLATARVTEPAFVAVDIAPTDLPRYVPDEFKKSLPGLLIADTNRNIADVIVGADAVATALGAPSSHVTDASPNLAAGIDVRQWKSPQYQDQLSVVTEALGAVDAKIKPLLTTDPDFIDTGFVPGTKSLVVYWTGPVNAPALTRAAKIADAAQVHLIVAARTVSKKQLAEATNYLEANKSRYNKMGITLTAFGGFAADFDGITVALSDADSTLTDLSEIRRILTADLHVPVQVHFASIHNF